jgi:hypothetical protein
MITGARLLERMLVKKNSEMLRQSTLQRDHFEILSAAATKALAH